MSPEILIVDDNSDIRNILNDLIIDAGYKTRLAANYNQALTEIDKKLSLIKATMMELNY
jgi:two-component system nitrogen regulation response regulator NtrX